MFHHGTKYNQLLAPFAKDEESDPHFKAGKETIGIYPLNAVLE